MRTALATSFSLLAVLAACSTPEAPPAPAVVGARMLELPGRPASLLSQVVVGFWNVENLFDTEDDATNPGDDEYLPAAGWTPELYATKLDHVASVIAAVAPHALGLAEVENRAVLDALVAHPALAALDYRIVHRDSPDSRGIDVALLHRAPIGLADVDAVLLHGYDLDGRPPSRGILEVPLALDGQRLTVLVNHWPSRGGDDDGAFRNAAAAKAREIVDRHLSADPDAALVLVGDFNDDPFDRSVRDTLRAVRSRNAAVNRDTGGHLWNPSWSLLAEPERGTLYYNREWVWNVFDQIIVSKGLLADGALRYVDGSLTVYAPKALRDQLGRPKWFRKGRDGEWTTGYSDHFMVHARIARPQPPRE